MDNKMIPYIAFEEIAVRQERTIKRLWILNILLILLALLLILTNIYWVWYENQFEYYEITQEVNTNENSNINFQNIGGDYYGEQSKANN